MTKLTQERIERFAELLNPYRRQPERHEWDALLRQAKTFLTNYESELTEENERLREALERIWDGECYCCRPPEMCICPQEIAKETLQPNEKAGEK